MGRLRHRPYSSLLAFREGRTPPLSQTDAAALVGITQAHWSRLENGLVGASPKLARHIADVTGVPAETLLNWGDDDSSVYAGVSPRLPSKNTKLRP